MSENKEVQKIIEEFLEKLNPHSEISSFEILNSPNDIKLSIRTVAIELVNEFKIEEETPKVISEVSSFRKIAEDFKDALNEVLKNEPYDDNVIDNLNSILELLDVTVENL